jgi:hypothetical protein
VSGSQGLLTMAFEHADLQEGGLDAAFARQPLDVPHLMSPQAVAGNDGHHPAPQGVFLLHLIQPGLHLSRGGDEAWGGRADPAAGVFEALELGAQLRRGDGDPSLGQVVHHLHHPVKAAGVGLARNQGLGAIAGLRIQRGRGVQTEALQLLRAGKGLVREGTPEVTPVGKAGEGVAVLGLGATGRNVGFDQRSDLSPCLQGAAISRRLFTRSQVQPPPVEPWPAAQQISLGRQQ